jgi:hypothetical protein
MKGRIKKRQKSKKKKRTRISWVQYYSILKIILNFSKWLSFNTLSFVLFMHNYINMGFGGLS